jgi:hypothetical protein
MLCTGDVLHTDHKTYASHWREEKWLGGGCFCGHPKHLDHYWVHCASSSIVRALLRASYALLERKPSGLRPSQCPSALPTQGEPSRALTVIFRSGDSGLSLTDRDSLGFLCMTVYFRCSEHFFFLNVRIPMQINGPFMGSNQTSLLLLHSRIRPRWALEWWICVTYVIY